MAGECTLHRGPYNRRHHLPNVAITVHDPTYVAPVRPTWSRSDLRGAGPTYVAAVAKTRESDDTVLRDTAPTLAAAIDWRWPVHRLFGVPALFGDDADARAALGLLVGDGEPPERVRARLETFFLPLYPDLAELNPSDRPLGRRLVAIDALSGSECPREVEPVAGGIEGDATVQ